MTFYRSADGKITDQREDTFLIAVTVVGQPSRMAAREAVYALMGADIEGRSYLPGRLDSWWDATVDSTCGHDNGDAVWTHPGRGLEAQRALVNLGLAPESDERVGHHPQVEAVRDGDRFDGHVLMFECVRCNNGAEHPAVLAEVPCIDLSKWEHAHYWVSGDLFVDSTDVEITCIADCGMTIVNGQAVGEVSDEAAGSPPESEHDYGYYPEN
jgi:hypothetical protein